MVRDMVNQYKKVSTNIDYCVRVTANDGEIGDNDKYLICYGDMTKLYKANGLHERNRSASIEAKETISARKKLATLLFS